MAIWRPVIMLEKGLLRASGKAAIDTCGGGLVRQPVTLVALQVEPSKIVTFIVKRFTTKTVFVSKSTPMATGESRTGTIALGEQSVVSGLLQCVASLIEAAFWPSLPSHTVRFLGSQTCDPGS